MGTLFVVDIFWGWSCGEWFEWMDDRLLGWCSWVILSVRGLLLSVLCAWLDFHIPWRLCKEIMTT